VSARPGVAFLAGINEYLHAEQIPTLRFAERDAEALAELLADGDVCRFPPERIRLLAGPQAGREEIVHSFEDWLPRQAKGAELAVLYFAGHGLVRRDGAQDQGYLLPYDADPDDLATKALAMTDVARWIERLEAAAVILCLDCCHAGQIVSRPGQPGLRDSTRDLEFRPDVLEAITGKGRFLLASCDAGQKSVESPQLRHGLFTYHLLEGLKGAADSDGNGRVGVAELFEYVAQAVERDARLQFGRSQRPWHTSSGPGGVYLSEPRLALLSETSSSFTLERLWVEKGAMAALALIEQRLPFGDEAFLIPVLRLLERKEDPAGLPVIFRCLAHSSALVRDRASRALQSLGWERTATAVEQLARRADEQQLGAILDGMMAIESHPEVVGLLDRLVILLKGALRSRAILLLERKRLGLERERIADLFRSKGSPYEIERVLGQGLFTAAFLARHRVTGLQAVVRLLRPEFAGQPHLRAQFLDLSSRAVQYIHPNLVVTRDVMAYPDQNVYYSVRDYVDGVTLQNVLESGKRFEEKDAITLLSDLLSALEPLHQRGAIHGGIKPSNIFCTGAGGLVLGDPSLPVQGIGLGLERLCYDYRYAAPETFRGGGALSPAADFYAFGCVAYEVFCGVPPFQADSPFDLATAHCREPYPSACERGASDQVDRLLRMLLAKSPDERPRKLQGIRRVLAEWEDLSSPTASSWAEIEVPKKDEPQPATGQAFQPYQTLLSFGDVGGTPPAEEQVAAITQSTSSAVDSTAVETPGAVVDLSDSGVFDTKDSSAPTARPSQAFDQQMAVGPPADLFGPNSGYRPLARIGRGAFGEVWRAEAPGGVEVAIKMISWPHAREIGQAAQISLAAPRELQALEITKQLRHPFLLAVHGYWITGDRLMIAMELADKNLRNRLMECKIAGLMGIPETELLSYIRDIAEGVDYLHAHNVLHRDIKPDNLMLVGGHAKVADFGLARITEANQVASTLVGTPTYLSPEQWRGHVGPKSDQYSLAVAYAELRLGHPPFSAPDMFQTMVGHLEQPPELAPLGGAEAEVLSQALAKHPDQRFPTCRAFAEALQAAVEQGTVPVKPTMPAAQQYMAPEQSILRPGQWGEAPRSRTSWWRRLLGWTKGDQPK
jgi:serine/threonine protein kinase